MTMTLYMHPMSATSRAVCMFADWADIDLEHIEIDLQAGEHRQPAFLEINPNGMVPVLDDGGFLLTESSAILKYLADKIGSNTYPKDSQDRARVNEALDWLSANFYRDFAFNLVYPQIFPHHRRRSREGSDATIEWGRDRADHWLKLLDTNMIGANGSYLSLDRLTIADFLARGMLGLGQAIEIEFEAYPNIRRWLAVVDERKVSKTLLAALA